MEDGRMEGGVALSHGQLGSSVTGGNLYGGGAPRSTTSSSSSQSPPATGPVLSSGSASTKMAAPTSNGGGRKYQCKMCPQVGSIRPMSFIHFAKQNHRYQFVFFVGLHLSFYHLITALSIGFVLVFSFHIASLLFFAWNNFSVARFSPSNFNSLSLEFLNPLIEQLIEPSSKFNR